MLYEREVGGKAQVFEVAEPSDCNEPQIVLGTWKKLSLNNDISRYY